MKPTRIALATLALALSTGLGLAACAKSDDVNDTTGSGGSGGGSGGGIPGEICLLHNCDTDLECAGCDQGRTHCLTAEHRCVACDAGGSGECPSGQKCSSWGNCVPESATCPTDNGVPTISCDSSADCVACDPAHLVCNTQAHKCVACTDNDTSECQSTDICVGGDCSPKCPAACQTDNDCSQCGAPGHEAHACNAHKCTQCGPTYACKAGEVCNPHGVCEKPCGLPGAVKGTCDSDADCAGCQGDLGACHQPINGGHGTCGPAATGCSDFGNGVVVLPDPWDQVTNTCSSDADCANIGIDFNVGKLLRDITGIDDIGDANIEYPMHACASITVADKSCGLCVPCRVDSDCQDINIDQVALDAFGPLGSVAASYLLDQVFGPSDHVVHMYCETIAEGFGVCAPCPGVLNDCSIGSASGTGSGSCAHDACAAGEALDPTCDECALELCAIDPYCCVTAWDDVCVAEVAQYCSNTCDGPGNEGCSHSVCDIGDKLDAGCSPCTTDLCQTDPYCCQTTWDQSCVDEVPIYCPGTSCMNPGNECDYASQCTPPDGCLWDHTCGPCYADYDCYPKLCDHDSGACY